MNYVITQKQQRSPQSLHDLIGFCPGEVVIPRIFPKVPQSSWPKSLGPFLKLQFATIASWVGGDPTYSN